MPIILHLDASNKNDGHSRRFSKLAVEKLLAAYPGSIVVRRDISNLPSLPNGAIPVWFDGTPGADSTATAEQKELLKLSEAICAEAFAADIIVIGSPLYNYGPATGMKSWIDHLVRIDVTLQYVDDKPVGMLLDKKALVLFSSGGTKMDSKRDFHTPWLRVVLEVVGITDHTILSVLDGELDAPDALDAAVAKL
jgi:FMN-dependent NADH-azoreductase